MRLIRWIVFFAALAVVYFGAMHTAQIKDAVVEEAPRHLGIKNEDWNHWSHISDQIRSGHMPDLNDKDWESLKKLYDSTDRTLRDHAVDVIKLLSKTQYKDKADAVTEKSK